MLFPDIHDDAAFEALRRTRTPWEPAIRAIAARHGLDTRHGVHLIGQGSCVLFTVGDAVVKLFEPWYLDHHTTETRVLAHLERAELPTPRLLVSEVLDGWGVVVMSRLPGEPLNLVWETLSPDDRADVCHQMGTLTRRLHAIPTTGLTLEPAWAAFEKQQRAGLRARHQDKAPALLDQIEHHVRRTVLPRCGHVLLHTELTDLNTLVEKRAGRWRVSGLVDFEPAMVGPPEYDLPSVAIFAAHGDRRAWYAALDALGVEPTNALRRRLMSYTLLHRYSNLPFFWSQVSPQPLPDSLDEIAMRFFP